MNIDAAAMMRRTSEVHGRSDRGPVRRRRAAPIALVGDALGRRPGELLHALQVRGGPGPTATGAAIAEDIRKYGDNERNVLKVVYDPAHLITDDREFAEPVLKRPAMQVRFVR
ncbi:MAG TPA: hypothetical protein VMS17_22065 [Gemmataceae bacterium]|nr:hypothetical protein [Gemmataceae bacterium]